MTFVQIKIIDIVFHCESSVIVSRNSVFKWSTRLSSCRFSAFTFERFEKIIENKLNSFFLVFIIKKKKKCYMVYVKVRKLE